MRIVVAGVTGSGKTTLARRIGAALDLPVVEMDALHHGPGWIPRPGFLEDVRAFAARDDWVCEWQYPAARPLLADRADRLVWLDLPTWLVMWRVVRRTVSRRIRHEQLWNGNTEAPLHTFFTDPEHVVRWAWRTRHQMRELVPTLQRQRPDLDVVHLRSRAETDAWVRDLL